MPINCHHDFYMLGGCTFVVLVSDVVIYALCRYSTMLQSWKASPEERPCFSELVDIISGQLESLAGYLHISTFTELENSF